jgi:UDP-N-acetylmuramate--alanine ligase
VSATVPSPAPRLDRPASPIDLSVPTRIHVVGVGGPGMSAIAIVLAQMGHRVSGSDLRERAVMPRLRAAGVTVHVGHDRRHVDGCDVVTASTAIPSTNNELDEAARRGIAVLRRAGMLASVCDRAQALAVAGTHGKTTTTSMLMLVLAEAGLRPSFVIGGDVNDIGTGAQWTGGDWLVVEADESDGTHLELPLHGTILTNVEIDHLDHYGTFDALVDSFDRYLAQVPGPRVVCADDAVAAELARRHDGITYGLAAGARYRAVDVSTSGGASRCRIERDGEHLVALDLPLRGIHNVVNATGAVAMAVEIGVEPEVAARALARFGGVARRFDIRGVDDGVTFVDDYAHLPSEIDAVLRAARDSGDGWTRVVAVFQPNRYHRIADMWREYADAFTAADVVVITDIYASGTTPIPGVTGKLVLNAVLDAHPHTRAVWLPRRDELVGYLATQLRRGDVCVSMGCGDVASLPDEVLAARLAQRGGGGGG